MPTEELIGIATAALFPIFLAFEQIWPARKFPKIPHWHVIGIALFFYVGILNTIVITAIPAEWLSEYRLMNFESLGLAPSIVVGHLLITLFQYGWHRATHEVDILWRVFHQIHHAPRHLSLYVQGVNHPLDLTIYMALPFLIGLFVLGVSPLAAAILANLGGFNAFLQHANIRTPRWVALFSQRPEAHCVHHQRGLHRYNYSDLPLWDVVFGTFRNPETWEGETGFDQPADQRYGVMLRFVDVNAPAMGEHSLGQINAPKD